MLGLCDQYIIIYKHICKIDVMPIGFRHMSSLEQTSGETTVAISGTYLEHHEAELFLCLFAALMPPR